MFNKYSIVQYNALKLVPGEILKRWGNVKPILIADKNTWAAAGEQVYNNFIQAGIVPEKIIFPETDVYAEYKQVEYIKSILINNEDLPLVIGSGTLNDIVKRATFELGRTYVLVPTAPSVDGFAATGASISVNGFKTTLPCDSPMLIIADTDVLEQAPLDMISAGYGDVFAKIPAGADWKIASILGIEPIDKKIWDIVQTPLRDRIAHPEKLLQRDGNAIQDFYKCLIDVGHAMELYADSRPASGAEHLFSHILEMNHLTYNGKIVSHGFKVAIGTLVSTALMTEILNMNTDIVNESNLIKDWDQRLSMIEDQFDSSQPNFKAVVDASKQKFVTGREQLIKSKFSEIKKAIEVSIFPFNIAKAMLKKAGCPVNPGDIGIDKETVVATIKKAQMIRKRYTVLDLLFEIGRLDEIIAKITESHTYFDF